MTVLAGSSRISKQRKTESGLNKILGKHFGYLGGGSRGGRERRKNKVNNLSLA